MAAGALNRAHALAAEALGVFEAESGACHPDVANVLNCLARVHEQRADYAAAEASAGQSVDIMRRVRQEVGEDAGSVDIDRLHVQALTGLGDILRSAAATATPSRGFARRSRSVNTHSVLRMGAL